MKPRLAFVDHSFHKKTQATAFLMDILSENFDIECIWDDSWSGRASVSVEYLNQQGFAFVLFFQVLFPVDELKKINAKLIWVPMYDGVVGRAPSFWMELSTLPIKIISFSKKVFDTANSFGIQSVFVQYYFDPRQFSEIPRGTEKKVFFWQRTKFSFNDIKKIIGKQKIDRFILKLDPDPGYEAVFPSKEDIKKYNIKIVQGSISKEEYLNLLASCNIFVSPRKFEGIGMSFIEAMMMGLAVVAFDKPTMNEYLKNHESGYLFSSTDLKEIDFSKFQDIGIEARKVCERGYEKWLVENEQLSYFIADNSRDPIKFNFVIAAYVKILRFSYKCLRKFGFYHELL